MRTDTFRGRDFITLLDWSKEEVEQILDLALDLKRDRATGRLHDDMLRAKTLFIPAGGIRPWIPSPKRMRPWLRSNT